MLELWRVHTIGSERVRRFEVTQSRYEELLYLILSELKSESYFGIPNLIFQDQIEYKV